MIRLEVGTDFAAAVFVLTSSSGKAVHGITNVRGITAIVLAVELVYQSVPLHLRASRAEGER